MTNEIEKIGKLYSDFMIKTEKERKNRSNDKIMNLKEKIIKFRLKEIEIRNNISIINNEIDEIRKKLNSSINITFEEEKNEINDEHILKFLKLQEANSLSELNQIISLKNSENKDLIKKIEFQKNKKKELQDLINKYSFGRTNEIESANNILKELQTFEYSNKNLNPKEKNNLNEKIIIEKHKQLVEDIQLNISIRDHLKNDQKILLEEIKRIDFLLYGRHGKYQKKKK